jgi:predicted RNA-binding Zn ribbon-like protein
MSHWLTERCGLLPAPAGLALVQDLLNTRKIGPAGTDLVDTAELADSWLPAAVWAWAADTGRPVGECDWAVRLSPRELTGLRTLRSDVLRLIAGEHLAVAGEPSERQLGKTELQVSASGDLRLEPTGTGWHRLAGSVWLEVFLAQQNGDWGRLKVCHNPVCGSAFFDRSRNNSGVWHDVKVCGNAANLRASRARKRLATAAAPPGGT